MHRYAETAMTARPVFVGKYPLAVLEAGSSDYFSLGGCEIQLGFSTNEAQSDTYKFITRYNHQRE